MGIDFSLYREGLAPIPNVKQPYVADSEAIARGVRALGGGLKEFGAELEAFQRLQLQASNDRTNQGTNEVKLELEKYFAGGNLSNGEVFNGFINTKGEGALECYSQWNEVANRAIEEKISAAGYTEAESIMFRGKMADYLQERNSAMLRHQNKQAQFVHSAITQQTIETANTEATIGAIAMWDSAEADKGMAQYQLNLMPDPIVTVIDEKGKKREEVDAKWRGDKNQEIDDKYLVDINAMIDSFGSSRMNAKAAYEANARNEEQPDAVIEAGKRNIDKSMAVNLIEQAVTQEKFPLAERVLASYEDFGLPKESVTALEKKVAHAKKEVAERDVRIRKDAVNAAEAKYRNEVWNKDWNDGSWKNKTRAYYRNMIESIPELVGEETEKKKLFDEADSAFNALEKSQAELEKAEREHRAANGFYVTDTDGKQRFVAATVFATSPTPDGVRALHNLMLETDPNRYRQHLENLVNQGKITSSQYQNGLTVWEAKADKETGKVLAVVLNQPMFNDIFERTGEQARAAQGYSGAYGSGGKEVKQGNEQKWWVSGAETEGKAAKFFLSDSDAAELARTVSSLVKQGYKAEEVVKAVKSRLYSKESLRTAFSAVHDDIKHRVIRPVGAVEAAQLSGWMGTGGTISQLGAPAFQQPQPSFR